LSSREKIVQKHQREKEEILDIIAALEQEFNQAENEAKIEFQNIRDDIKTKSGEELVNLRAKLDGRIEVLEAEFHTVRMNYL
jgi:hypothetical protein